MDIWNGEKKEKLYLYCMSFKNAKWKRIKGRLIVDTELNWSSYWFCGKKMYSCIQLPLNQLLGMHKANGVKGELHCLIKQSMDG